MSNTRDARVVSRSDGITLCLVKHRTELTDMKWFAVLSDALLHEKHRTFRVDFDKNPDDKQRQK